MKICWLLGIVLLLSCAGGSPDPQDTLPPDSLFTATYNTQTLPNSAAFATGQSVGTVTDASLAEASGVAASQTNKGYLWVHEDSDNPNQIQLINPAGEVKGVFTLPGIANRDWEDIAVGPGPQSGTNYIYLADIGDNLRQYATKRVYRFPEPDLAGQTLPAQADVANIETITVSLPDSIRNAEALLVDPQTKDIYLISKDNTTAGVYAARYPQSTTQTIVMQKLAVLPFSQVTAAAVSPDGREMLVKTYLQIFHFKKTGSESLTELFRKTPATVPYTLEPQGEAIGFAADNSGFYTLSEKPTTLAQSVYFYKRK
jgi:hypothetical protein